MRKLVALLFIAALTACASASSNQSANWDSSDPCWREDVMNGGNGSLCQR